MAAPSSQTQWYLARDGQQFGPLSEAELAKFIELGHLAPNDLLWREGFSEWRPAMGVVPPPRPAPAPPPPPTPSADAPARDAASQRRAQLWRSHPWPHVPGRRARAACQAAGAY